MNLQRKTLMSIDKEKKDSLRHLRQELVHETEHLILKLRTCVLWILLASGVGLFVGAYSTAFAFTLKKSNAFRDSHDLILLLLPFAGLLIVWLYHKCGVYKDKGTNLVIGSINSDSEVPGTMALLIFISTILTHLCGGSAGREGAALQMGGSLGNVIARRFNRGERTKKILIMCGMSAAFAAVFGTPMAATLFSMEVISVGIIHYSALVPCVFASLVASRFATQMGIDPEAFDLAAVPAFNLVGSIKIFLLALCCAAISALFIMVLHGTGRLYSRYLKNPYLRVFTGGCIIVVLTLLLGTRDYNGAGVGLIERAIHNGAARPCDFIVKMLFTAITLQAGFKGGEIVPSFCIGATFGCFFGSIIGMDPSFCAAIGMAAVFCGATNCPLTTLLISFELFGFDGIPYFMIAIAVSYLLSGYKGLYSDQIIVYSKYRPRFINRHAGDDGDDDLVDGY